MKIAFEKNSDRVLIRKIHAIPNKIFRGVFRKAPSEAMKPMKKNIQSRSPVVTGALKRRHGRRTFVQANKGQALAVVGIRPGVDIKSGKRPTLYAQWVHDRRFWMTAGFQQTENTSADIWLKTVRDGLIQATK